jgi:hypothetical protein
VVIEKKLEVYFSNESTKKKLRKKKEVFDSCNYAHKKIDVDDMTHISDMKFLDGSFLMILQNTGAFQIAHPSSSQIVQQKVLQTGCSNGLFAFSQDGRKNLLVVNACGKVAETYKYESNGSTKIDNFHC